MRGINNGDNSIFKLAGNEDAISPISDKDIRRKTVEKDMENDPELKEILLQAERNFQSGDYYTSEEMRELIRKGEV